MKPVPSTIIEAFRRDPAQYQAVKGLLDAENETRRALEAGTYAARPQYGLWDVLDVPAWSMRAGTVAPTNANFQGIASPQFAATASLHGGACLPGTVLDGSSLWAELHFGFPTAPTAGQNVLWLFSLTAAPRGGAFRGTTSLFSATYVIAPQDTSRDCVFRVPAPEYGVGPLWRLAFSVQRGADTSGVAPVLLGVSFLFQKGRIGVEAQPA